MPSETPPIPPGAGAAGVPLRAEDVLDQLDDDSPAAQAEPSEPSELKGRPSANNHKRNRAKSGKPARQGGARPGESRHSPRRIEAVESQKKALEMRMRGLAYSAIAEKLGLASGQTAWNMVESALQRTIQEPADAVRKVELGRLDVLFMVAYHKVIEDRDMHASQQALNIMNRRARLLGLDAPVQTVNKTTVSTDPEGTVVIAPVMSPEEWDKLVKAQQAEAMVDRAALRAGDAGDTPGGAPDAAPPVPSAPSVPSVPGGRA